MISIIDALTAPKTLFDFSDVWIAWKEVEPSSTQEEWNEWFRLRKAFEDEFFGMGKTFTAEEIEKWVKDHS